MGATAAGRSAGRSAAPWCRPARMITSTGAVLCSVTHIHIYFDVWGREDLLLVEGRDHLASKLGCCRRISPRGEKEGRRRERKRAEGDDGWASAWASAWALPSALWLLLRSCPHPHLRPCACERVLIARARARQHDGAFSAAARRST